VTGTPVEELQLPTRPYNCLKRADVNTIDELCAKTWEDLWGLRGFGVRSLKQVEQSLAAIGRSLSAPRFPHHIGNNPNKES
jgi:DNA-directed RNA polymerase subunit alpha